jgi:hypothetical protein
VAGRGKRQTAAPSSAGGWTLVVIHQHAGMDPGAKPLAQLAQQFQKVKSVAGVVVDIPPRSNTDCLMTRLGPNAFGNAFHNDELYSTIPLLLQMSALALR